MQFGELRETTLTKAELEALIRLYQNCKVPSGRLIAEAARETLRSRQE